MATAAELYRRIMDRMADDPEVVALCRSHVERADAQLRRTQGRIAQVKALLSSLGEEGATAADAAASLSASTGEEWSARKASWYLSRLVRDGEAEAEDLDKGPKRYRLSTLV